MIFPTHVARWTSALAITGALLLPHESRSQEGRSPSRATSTSALATAVPIAAGVAVAAAGNGGVAQSAISGVLMWGGALVGPAAGYIAEGEGASARKGVLFRSAIFAFAWVVNPTDDFDDGFVPNPDLDNMGAWLLAVPAIALSATYDVVVANRRVRAARAKVGVLPMRTRDGVGVRVTISRQAPRPEG